MVRTSTWSAPTTAGSLLRYEQAVRHLGDAEGRAELPRLRRPAEPDDSLLRYFQGVTDRVLQEEHYHWTMNCGRRWSSDSTNPVRRRRYRDRVWTRSDVAVAPRIVCPARSERSQPSHRLWRPVRCRADSGRPGDWVNRGDASKSLVLGTMKVAAPDGALAVFASTARCAAGEGTRWATTWT